MSLYPDERICKIILFQYKSVGHSTVNICQDENWPSSLFVSSVLHLSLIPCPVRFLNSFV